MAGAEGVVFRFVAAQKPADAAVLLDCREQVSSSGYDLMSISLMAHIPDQPVSRCIKCIGKSNGQFDGAERSARMAADSRHGFQDVLTNFVGYGLQLLK